MAVEIDLHGMRRDEALAAAEHALNAAFMAGERILRVLCGNGAGILLAVVGAHFEAHPLVDSYQLEVESATYVVEVAPRGKEELP